MSTTAYRFAIEIFSQDGKDLGQVPVSPDWEPALESAAFGGIRRGQLPAVIATPTGSIDPIWHPKLKAPFLSGFRAVVPCRDGSVSNEIPTAYVRALAQQASAAFVENGALKSGELFSYLVTAFPTPNDPPPPDSAAGFAVEEVVQPLPFEDSALDGFLNASAACAATIAEDDVPVFVPRRVLDEAAALARQTREVETGGVLVGKLHQDRSLPEVFVEITAQIPAQHALSQATKLTFTADTWTAVQAALQLRRRGEIMLGWWHYHPDFCRKCPEEKRRQCTLTSAFFSAEDAHLHRVCFGRAYHVALLVSDNIDTGMAWSLFGWRRGLVEARGFRILGDSCP